MIENVKDSFIAGILIGLGCIANMSTTIPVLGPFLFSIGLITVIVQGRHLYTGAIGYLKSYKDIPYLIVMILTNLIGIAFICGLFSEYIDTSPICNIKYNETFYEAYVKSIGCGMLMFISVEGYRLTKKLLSVILPVMTFIICGFDHCIANYGYMILNGDFICWQLPIWVVGNSIGSLIISKI